MAFVMMLLCGLLLAILTLETNGYTFTVFRHPVVNNTYRAYYGNHTLFIVEEASDVEVFVRNADGTILLTIREKRLGISRKWNIFQGEDSTDSWYTSKRLNHRPQVAHVELKPRSRYPNAGIYEIEGSFTQYHKQCNIILHHGEQEKPHFQIHQRDPANGNVFDVICLYANCNKELGMAMAVVLDKYYPPFD